MQDFPDSTACILWVAGCNMRCGYCHNPQIVLGKGVLSEADVLNFLHRRKGLLDGVVLSGGEATAWPGLIAFTTRVKAMGFAVKLDTNGGGALLNCLSAIRLACSVVVLPERTSRSTPTSRIPSSDT